MKSMPFSPLDVGEAESEEVTKAILSDWITKGIK